MVSKAEFRNSLLEGMADIAKKAAAQEPSTIGQQPTVIGGQMTANLLRERISELEEQMAKSTSGGGIRLSPKLIKQSRWANRMEQSYLTADFADLKNKISATGGNVQPILVYKNEAGEYELIFGHRRLRACLELGVDVLALVYDGEISDALIFLTMHAENTGQKSPSVWELGHWYRHALTEGLVPSKRALAEMLGLSHTWINVAMDAADLPPEVVGCWTNPVDIQSTAVKALKKALEGDREAVLLRAAVVRDMVPALSADKVLQHLLFDDGVTGNEKPRPLELAHGRKYGTVRRDGAGRAILVLDKAFKRADIQKLLAMAADMAKEKPELQKVEKPKKKSKKTAPVKAQE